MYHLLSRRLSAPLHCHLTYSLSLSFHLGVGGKQAKGRTLVLVKLLDGQTMQLYAETSTTGQELLDQICTVLKAYETYYFGLQFFDHKVGTQRRGGRWR